MYWEDARERHGTGRRPFRQPDNMSYHFAGHHQDARAAGPPSRGGVAASPAAPEGSARPAENCTPLRGTPGGVASSPAVDLFGRPSATPPPAQESPYPDSRRADLDQSPEQPVGQDLGAPAASSYRSAQAAYMDNQGPPPQRNGDERRVFFEGGEDTRFAPCKRGSLQNHLRSEVLKPAEDAPPPRPRTNAEMKASMREWMIEAHNMIIVDEGRWDAALLEQHGCNWRFQALTEQCRSITREGNTARAIAEKFSMMPVSELRYFGLRFAGQGDKRPSTQEANPTLLSPGVYDALSKNGPTGHDYQMSSARRHPEDQARRYIASGQDHFEGVGVGGEVAPGMHGSMRDMNFSDGLERGVGHGKRRINTQDHLFGSRLSG